MQRYPGFALGSPELAETILVIDDDPIFRMLMRDILEEAGLEVIEVPEGSEADEICRRRSISLVLTDLVMPGAEGIETIKQLRNNYPYLPIVAVSGAFGGAFLKIASFLGADAAVRKPFTAEQLLQVIDDQLSRRRRRR